MTAAWWEKPVRQDTQWMNDSLCREVGFDLFFPEQGDSFLDGKTVCRRCKVIDPCLEWALEQPGIHGILGGTTKRDRERIRSRGE